MSDPQEPVTRLGPNSGGRLPGDGDVRVYHWEWGPDDARRPGLPWIGIFLLVFGALLLIQQAFPAVQGARIGLRPGDRPGVHRQVGDRSRHRLALRRRDHHRPGRAEPAQRRRDRGGWPRARSASGSRSCSSPRSAPSPAAAIGWQLWFGGFLTLLGAVNIAGASFGGYVVPIVLVALGLLLILRGAPGRVR